MLARLASPDDARTVLLCAHLDTVPLDAPVQVRRQDGSLSNANEAILGADNKAAVATVLAAVGRLAGGGLAGGARSSVHHQRGARPARRQAFDRGKLSAEFGFVFDHASPIGELVVASPTYYRLEARFKGKAAHAGIRPEAGRNAIAAASRAVAAMRLGRLDQEMVYGGERRPDRGGTSPNVVAERCTVELEARSLDEARAGEVVGEMVDALTEAASDAECDVETSVERLFRGYRLPRTAPPVEAAAAALEAAASSRVHHHRRRQRRERADRGRPAGAQRGQRHRAQPPARRVGHRRGARDDARRHSRDRRGGGSA